MDALTTLRKKLKNSSNPEQAVILQGFFKTGTGEYGEGDKFIGLRVPELRKLAKQYQSLNFADLKSLIQSPIHEERLLALLILIKKYNEAKNEKQKDIIYRFYTTHLSSINNWDLVDLSAPYITGHYLFNKDKSILKKWAQSKDLWKRRIAIVSTVYFIRQNHFQDTLEIAEILLNDTQDLIHKAVGWMLREIGKRDLKIEESFLKQYYKTMPRTMLRYAIERFEENKRQAYLKGRI